MSTRHANPRLIYNVCSKCPPSACLYALNRALHAADQWRLCVTQFDTWKKWLIQQKYRYDVIITWHIRQKSKKQIQTIATDAGWYRADYSLANKNVKLYTATHLVLQSSVAADLTWSGSFNSSFFRSLFLNLTVKIRQNGFICRCYHNSKSGLLFYRHGRL